jgi:hypothetical protein
MIVGLSEGHKVAEERVRFECSICGMSVETEGARVNYERTCTAGTSGVGDR